MDIYKEIGFNIFRSRIEKEISQEDLAAKIGESRWVLHKIEIGKCRHLDLGTLVKISVALDTTFPELLTSL